MSEASDDELLLSRYVDGEVTDDERASIETRLEKDAGLRSRVARLVSLNTVLEIGLSQTASGLSDDAPGEKVTGRRRAQRGIGTAASVCLLLLGAGTWWGLRGHDSSRHDDPFRVIERLDAVLDRGALEAQVTELLDPETAVSRRLAIYEGWWSLPHPAIEPLVWAMAPREALDSARESLYATLPAERPVADYPALIAAARREWTNRALRPLAVLMTHLQGRPGPESEALVEEVLEARTSLPPSWFAQRLPTIQSVAPKSASVGALLVKALHDPDETVRAWAGLTRASIHQRDGIECARTLLNSQNDDVRVLAVTTIGRHGLDADVSALAGLSNDPCEGVRVAVRKTLVDHHIAIPSNP